MTKEQEAIEYLKESVLIYKNTIPKISKAIEIVLSMLKEKDKEIEHQIEKRNNQKAELTILNQKQKEMNKLINTVKSYKGQIKRLEHTNRSYKGIISKQNKQIDLMAEEINETDRGYTDYCETKIECDRNCKDCIKQYFERKSKEC